MPASGLSQPGGWATREFCWKGGVETRNRPFCEKVVIDFTDVRTANSSFVNALIAGVVERHGRDVPKILVFKGCNPVIRVLVDGAIALGLQKTEGRIDA